MVVFAEGRAPVAVCLDLQQLLGKNGPRCYRSRQTGGTGQTEVRPHAPSRGKKKRKIFRHVPKIFLCALGQQVDYGKAGVALGDDVAAAEDAGGRLGCDARHVGAERA